MRLLTISILFLLVAAPASAQTREDVAARIESLRQEKTRTEAHLQELLQQIKAAEDELLQIDYTEQLAKGIRFQLNAVSNLYDKPNGTIITFVPAATELVLIDYADGYIATMHEGKIGYLARVQAEHDPMVARFISDKEASEQPAAPSSRPPVVPATPQPTTTSGNSTIRHSGAVQCSGTTRSGARCKRMTTSTNGRCWQHGG